MASCSKEKSIFALGKIMLGLTSNFQQESKVLCTDDVNKGEKIKIEDEEGKFEEVENSKQSVNSKFEYNTRAKLKKCGCGSLSYFVHF